MIGGTTAKGAADGGCVGGTVGESGAKADAVAGVVPGAVIGGEDFDGVVDAGDGEEGFVGVACGWGALVCVLCEFCEMIKEWMEI
jgi:hypothetical protein